MTRWVKQQLLIIHDNKEGKKVFFIIIYRSIEKKNNKRGNHGKVKLSKKVFLQLVIKSCNTFLNFECMGDAMWVKCKYHSVPVFLGPRHIILRKKNPKTKRKANKEKTKQNKGDTFFFNGFMTGMNYAG